MTNELITIETVQSIAAVNRPQIAERVQKAKAALSAVKEVTNEEQDKYANDLLVKCNNTLPIIENLRKEYTSKIDAWKASEMILEKELKDEMERVRGLRNEHAQATAKANKAKEEEALKKKAHDQEVVRIKHEIVASVKLGLAERINKAEETIEQMFTHSSVVDNVVAQIKTIKPALKEEKFMEWLVVPFDLALVSLDEYRVISNNAFEALYVKNKAADNYLKEVNSVIAKWVAYAPEKKKELLKLESATGEEAERLKKVAADKAEQERIDREAKEKAEKEKLRLETEKEVAKESLSIEFNHQVAVQSIEEQSGVRKEYYYRFADEARVIRSPEHVIQVLLNAMTAVLSDPANLGIFERGKSNMPKRDDQGHIIYVDGVQYWLDELARLPNIHIEGLIKVEKVTSIAKARKEKV